VRVEVRVRVRVRVRGRVRDREALTIVCSERRHPVGPGGQSQQLLCGPALPCSRLFTPVGAVRGLVRVRVGVSG